MDIYKISDFEKDSNILDDSCSKYLVTDLKQGVKNPNRVNVFINGQYSFSLDVSQIVDYKLKVGIKLSGDKYAELKKASEFGKLYQRTLEWVLMRPRSVKETRDYLFRKLNTAHRKSSIINKNQKSEALNVALRQHDYIRENYSELSDGIIRRLLDRGYIDDQKFAEYYVENRFVKKGVSQKRLKMELIKKGVGNEIIDEILGERNDEEEIRKMIQKKRAKYDVEKLTAYLCRQGFSYDLVKSVMNEYVD